MVFHNKNAGIYVPDGMEVKAALARTTDLCIGAHQDDIEIMAYGPIAVCFAQEGRHFTGVTVTDGGGSPRTGIYANYTDEQMMVTRAKEQNAAAQIGQYAAQVSLAWPSSGVKTPNNRELVAELKEIIEAAAPETVYTHNLADKHNTHVAVAIHVIHAMRAIHSIKRPRLVGMEVWRGLDWLCDEDKVVHDTSPHPNLSAALLGVYDSQITGGKRYDLATQGRRLANATFFESHAVDSFESAAFGIDMTPLTTGLLDPVEFITWYVEKFKTEVKKRVKQFI